MTGERALVGGVALLERAINYTLGSLHLVTLDSLADHTPCQRWDLRDLLRHMDDSLLAMQEAVDIGTVDLDGPIDNSGLAVDLAARLRNRACHLLGAWTAAGIDHTITIGGCPLTGGLVTGTGAIEIAVHGWDVAQACGQHRPIPPSLAEELLELAPMLVTDVDRPGRFAAPVHAQPQATPSDRLLAFLGRRPWWASSGGVAAA